MRWSCQNAHGPFSCLGYVNTGTKVYTFSGPSQSLTDGTFARLYGMGSTGRIIMQSGLFTVNSAGQQVRTLTITLKP
jgi:hypothetical protein